MGDELGALVKDASAAQDVVSDLTVAHVTIGWHAHGDAMSRELRAEGFELVAIEIGGLGTEDGICFIASAEPHAVHDHGYDRASNGGMLSLRECEGLGHSVGHSSTFLVAVARAIAARRGLRQPQEDNR